MLFPSGSAELTDEGSKALAEVAKILRGMRNRRFIVAGHTDNVPVATERFEQQLGAVVGARRQGHRGADPRRPAARAARRRGLQRIRPGRAQRQRSGPAEEPPHRDHPRAAPQGAARPGQEGQAFESHRDEGQVGSAWRASSAPAGLILGTTAGVKPPLDKTPGAPRSSARTRRTSAERSRSRCSHESSGRDRRQHRRDVRGARAVRLFDEVVLARSRSLPGAMSARAPACRRAATRTRCSRAASSSSRRCFRVRGAMRAGGALMFDSGEGFAMRARAGLAGRRPERHRYPMVEPRSARVHGALAVAARRQSRAARGRQVLGLARRRRAAAVTRRAHARREPAVNRSWPPIWSSTPAAATATPTPGSASSA